MLVAAACLLQTQSPEPRAQSPAPPAQPATPAAPQPTGSVTGHVFCSDTHLPARMASVILVPAAVARRSADSAQESASATQTETSLDGSFTLAKVAPGSYYISAEKVGYIAVAHKVLGMVFGNPDGLSQAQRDALAEVLTPIVVVANHAATAELTLIKGAAISGTVRYDDGPPDSQAFVALLHKDKSAKWVPYVTATFSMREDGGVLTDDLGNFRIAGLPAGEYMLKASVGYSIDDGESVSVYPPNVTRRRDAKIVKLNDGEESAGNNIEIPLSKLHLVSGTVISAESGAPVNSARVELHYADDDSLLDQTTPDGDADEFRFAYVPEGEYNIKVTRAADVTSRTKACANCPVEQPEGEKILREYEDASQSLIVKGETNGLAIQVKPKPPAAVAAAQ